MKDKRQLHGEFLVEIARAAGRAEGLRLVAQVLADGTLLGEVVTHLNRLADDNADQARRMLDDLIASSVTQPGRTTAPMPGNGGMSNAKRTAYN